MSSLSACFLPHWTTPVVGGLIDAVSAGPGASTGWLMIAKSPATSVYTCQLMPYTGFLARSDVPVLYGAGAWPRPLVSWRRSSDGWVETRRSGSHRVPIKGSAASLGLSSWRGSGRSRDGKDRPRLRL